MSCSSNSSGSSTSNVEFTLSFHQSSISPLQSSSTTAWSGWTVYSLHDCGPYNWMRLGHAATTTITLYSMSSFETGSSFSLHSSSSSSLSSPVISFPTWTSSSWGSSSVKSLLSLAVSSADVGSVCASASLCIFAEQCFWLHPVSGRTDIVFHSTLKEPDGAAEAPVYIHCPPPSWPWYWTVHSACGLKHLEVIVVQSPLLLECTQLHWIERISLR